MGDYKVGLVERPTVSLATAVAASSAFPPPLSPLRLNLGDGRGQVILSDGGVYDNLGLEAAWKRYRTVLVSDAGGRLEPVARPSRNMLLQMPRVVTVIDGQVRSLRRKQVIASLADGTRTGAYWSIRRPIAPAPGALPVPPEEPLALAEIRTRLKRLDAATQERLVRWGYACADASVRAYYAPAKDLPPPVGFL
jgi:NTE family protein